MIDQERLQEWTESYLKAVISEGLESSNADFDSLAAFGELGINSYLVLKIIKKLERDFGTLPKSLLFENFNVADLARFFVEKHGETLSAKFAEALRSTPAGTADWRTKAVDENERRDDRTSAEVGPILIRETDARSHPGLKDLVLELYALHKIEGSVSRGTRLIAPNLFIGSAKRGYFHYGRSKEILVVYGYTGPAEYLPVLLEDLYDHCISRNLQLNILTADPIPAICDKPFSATPFGVLQRVTNLQGFTLDGGPMRRLRYQVTKFQKAGQCRTEEYRSGADPETDRKIAAVIDRWCESRTVVNPLVHEVKAEILAGELNAEHRLFLTYLDDVLQNAILISPMCAEVNGYLMDLEFYLPDMPLGGLEFAITEMIGVLVRDGCEVLSLGGTYGCKLEPSATADIEVDRVLDDLRAQGIFNDEGNLQFKSKFRPESRPIFLCRPVGSPNPDNVVDIIMMIADPSKAQVPDEGQPRVLNALSPALVHEVLARPRFTAAEAVAADSGERPVIGGHGRSRVLADHGFNPLSVPHEHVEIDLKTDSWAQLHMPAIEAQMRHLRSQLGQPASLDNGLRAIFPFAHLVLTRSGQAAESIFFRAWSKKGVVPQNLLFPSTIFHQIDNGFTPKELPHPALFQPDAADPCKGNLDLDALEVEVARDPSAIAFVCIEVGNNAAGGHPVSTRHLRDLKAVLAPHSIPLVIDGTRIVQNAQLLIATEREHGGKGVWAVVREVFSYADAVIGSLTKEFCVDKGGIVACNDVGQFQRLQELADREGAGIDLIERKLIALSLQNRKHIESRVSRKTENARRIGEALAACGAPMVHPGGGHSILIDPKRIPEFGNLQEPVPSFLAWMYLATGIRGAAHSVGMQRGTRMNGLVRLAIPAGFKPDDVERVVDRLVEAFARKVDVPELVAGSGASLPGGVDAKYTLARVHNSSGRAASRIESVRSESRPSPVSATPEERAAPGESITVTESPVRREAQQAGRTQSPPPRDIAIVGMAGRYPKAKNIRELWQNLVRGRDCVDEIPADRLERRLLHGGRAKYRGGFIDNVDRFDSLFFNISPREAEMLDPQERLFLEVAWEAIEDAGYYPEILAQEEVSRNVGVFVGAVWAMYQIVGVEEQHAGNQVAPNSFLWSIANRVSYWMNLCGPSLTVDTACSSSLTAFYLACEAIQAGECSAAIVGGVNLDLHQAKLDINLIGGALSPDGVCRAFGKGANGYVAGEGVGALFLKPLDRALQDGDHVYGVVRSATVNHGGRTSGYFVPNPRAQANVIGLALRKASVDARSIGYVEAHGTGTELGDPIEIAGLSSAFSADHVENQTCAIGSIKTNIGHLEAAAGIASLTKVLLQMKHRTLVPSLHSSELNELIDFDQSPFYVVRGLEEWKAKEVDGVRLPLRAGISSFGAGGANAHIILESYELERRKADEPAGPEDLIFPLSARNEDQLRDAAVRLAQFLPESDVDLRSVASTLQHGRKSFEHRMAITAGTTQDLVDRLTRFVEGKKHEDVAVGHVKVGENVTRLLNRREKDAFVRLLAEGRDPRKVAGLWAEGLLADWQGFQPERAGRRVSLPTYPFAGRQHWVGASSARRVPQLGAGLHPMVDSNESTFERQLFKKTFHDRDFFIYDHLVSDIPTLPGVAYLELAREAGEIAAGRPVRRIQNILWVSPIAVRNSNPQEVFIELKPDGEVVQFEVFSETDGGRALHAQGRLLYTNREDGGPESIDLAAVRARCTKAVVGKDVYPRFKSFGLNLGPSFQVLREVQKSDEEALGVLCLPEFRHADLDSMLLHPSLVDGSLQAGMAARLGDGMGEMLVPYSIGEVEILHSLPANCLSYVTEAKDGKRDSRVLRSNVLILDEAGKVLARIRESTGVPLLNVHKTAESGPDAEGFSTLYYSYEWERAKLPVDEPGKRGSRSILLFDTNDSLRDLWAAELRNAGETAVLVRPGAVFRRSGDHSFEINPSSREDFTRLFETLAECNRPVEDIGFAWNAGPTDFRDESALRGSLDRGVSSFLFLCQAVVQAGLERGVQLLYLYSTSADGGQPQNEAVTGFVNTLRVEYPKLRCKTLEVRGAVHAPEEVFHALRAELVASVQDGVAVRYEGGDRSVRKLRSCDLEASGAGPQLREKGVYLITGGAGGLGLIFAEFLAKECRARLVLTGRSPLSDELSAKLDALKNAGAEILYLQGDVSRRDDVETLLKEARARFGSVHGIIHSAGIVRDSYIRNKTAENMAAVLAPKVFGTLHLDDVTRDEPLDFFVTFSSLAAVTGNPGQSDYSFANSFMDSFAVERERAREAGERSGKTLSVNWSLWAEGGMRPDEQTERALRKTLGMKPLSSESGIAALLRGLATGLSQIVVVEGIQERLELAWGVRKKAAPPATPMPAGHPVAAPLPAKAEGSLLQWLQDELSQITMRLLKLEVGEVSPDKILLDLGFDSIGLMTFANAINDRLGLDITPVLFFDYPSIQEIAENLAEERASDLLRVRRGAEAAVPAVPSPRSRHQLEVGVEEGGRAPTFEIRNRWNPAIVEAEPAPKAGGGGFPEHRFVENPIAVVGMSGVMPQSENLEEFWDNLRNSKDLVTVIPPDRWRWEDYFGDPLKEANKSNSKWGAFMKEIDKFDPLFFGISPREAQMMDPQQRIFLEHVWKAVEDSGQRVSDLAGTKTGVFVGVATNDYLDVLHQTGAVLDGYSASGNSHSVLANRVSFLLGLRGPSAPLDTACSSSLIAMHRALESIHTGSCDMAIVGGVQVMLSPAAYISFSSAGMLSPDGRCKTFDKSANGYVRGEGCGAVFLKSLAAAEADGNPIYAVIRATAENHGGRVTAMTAPNASAQAELLIEAYAKGQVDPAAVGYIECHGTGTSLGDPIEIQGLSKAFSELYRRKGKTPADIPHIGLGTVKTNIGHLETAAGIAGILKALLAIKHGQIPANLHLQDINPYISLKGTPFFIVEKLTSWDSPTRTDGSPSRRIAGVSSFGFGGANAHVVFEEYIPATRSAPASAATQLIVLSAKNADRLSAYVRSLRVFLDGTAVELADLAYTLQVGRDEMPERLALVVSDIEELKQKLQQFLEGATLHGVYRKHVGRKSASTPVTNGNPGDGVMQSLIESRELLGIAELWVSGAPVDWRSLYGPDLPRRVSAPTYPFARERYWIPERATRVTERPGPAAAATAWLHPLIHRNSSTFEEQKFSTRFTGEEFFLADHVVETQRILPGVAYLEMARVAGELSASRTVRVIRSLIWERPLIVGDEVREVEVALTPDRQDVKFAIRSAGGDGAVTHCTGQLGYVAGDPAHERLDIARIWERCPERVLSREDLYPFLSSGGLNLGRSFQIVESIFANESEALGVLALPEQLKESADQFWLHPALMDGALHTAIGLLKANGLDASLALPYSVGEVQILQPLKDLHYGYATWGPDSKTDASRRRVTFHLLDNSGRVLVRLKDFTTRPLPSRTTRPTATLAEIRAGGAQAAEELKALVPIWNPVRLDESGRVAVADSSEVLLLCDERPRLEWLRKDYPKARSLTLDEAKTIDGIAGRLREETFDQLLWIAPDAGPQADCAGDILEQQEAGVLAVFRIVKALLQLGYGERKLDWTLVTTKAQRITGIERIQAAHAGVVGLVGSLAKEHPGWNVRLLDVDALESLSAGECLTAPINERGDALAYRHGEWFRQGMALVATLPEAQPAYRRDGVYVVIGGAGGVGEVWTRHLIEQYQANVVWIGRRERDAKIDASVRKLSELGPAPQYISADAAEPAVLERARRTVLDRHPAIHGVVHSAIVLRDQSLARMDESEFRAGLSAKIDVSVNMDRVFGSDRLDFMLFFSSIVSVVKPPGQSNYAAGCTFKDSFAHSLRQRRPYPVKIMNWGYWGGVGVVADESYKRLMRQSGIGSIEPREGLAALQALIGSDLQQLALVKTLDDRVTASFNLTETIRYHPAAAPATVVR